MFASVFLRGFRADGRSEFPSRREPDSPRSLAPWRTGLWRLLGIVLGNFGIVGNRVAMLLQFGDCFPATAGADAGFDVGSLMMLASGLSVSAPSSASESGRLAQRARDRQKPRRMRRKRGVRGVWTVDACLPREGLHHEMGSSELMAQAGASSVLV